MDWGLKDARTGKARQQLSDPDQFDIKTNGHERGGPDAAPSKYDPSVPYDAKAQFAELDATRLRVADSLDEFTNPFKHEIMSTSWLAAIGMLAACSAGMVIFICGILGYELNVLIKAAMVYVVPLLILFFIAFQRMRLPFRLRIFDLHFERYLDDEVARILSIRGASAEGALESNKPISDDALFQLLRLRLEGYLIWHRVSIHQFVMGFQINSVLKLPFISPRFIAIMAPLTLVATMVIFRLGVVYQANGNGERGFPETLSALGLELVGMGTVARPTASGLDLALIAGGIAASLIAMIVAHAYRDSVRAHLVKLADPEPYFTPYSYDYTDNIVQRYKTVREEMVECQRHRFGRPGSGSEGGGTEGGD